MWSKFGKPIAVAIFFQYIIYELAGKTNVTGNFFSISLLLGISFYIFGNSRFKANLTAGSRKISKHIGNRKNKVVNLEKYRKRKEKLLRKKKTGIIIKTIKINKGKKPEENIHWVKIYSSSDQIKIDFKSNLLEQHKITCYKVNKQSASMFPKTNGIEIEIMVDQEDVDKAIKLIQESEQEPI